MRIYVFSPGAAKVWRLNVTSDWARRHDNGALFSLGLNIPDNISLRSIQALARRGRAVECDPDEANHGGCQSSCTRRGDSRCSW